MRTPEAYNRSGPFLLEKRGPPAPARAPGGPPTSPLVWTTPSRCPSALIKPSGSFAGVVSHRSGRPSHQAVLCQLPQESKCTAFPAKTCLRHAVAKAHTFAVKRAGARCPIPGSTGERLQWPFGARAAPSSTGWTAAVAVVRHRLVRFGVDCFGEV